MNNNAKINVQVHVTPETRRWLRRCATQAKRVADALAALETVVSEQPEPLLTATSSKRTVKRTRKS